MYIAPNTSIELFCNLSLDSNYSDTGFFETVEAKDNFFRDLPSEYKLGAFNIVTFQRENINFCKVEAAYGTVYKANYMRFKNSNFLNKWFYAFVTSVEYINNEVVQINYTLDVMMTWMGEFTIPECYVERNHTTTDVFGDNLIAEPFNFSDYVTQENHPVYSLNNDVYQVIVAYAFSGLEDAQDGRLVDGVYSGVGLKCFSLTNLAGINAFVEHFVPTPNSILAMYIVPQACTGINTPETGEGIDLPISSSSREYLVGLSSITTYGDNPSSLDGYVPRNRKLYSYPFNFCSITNNQGNAITARYEYTNSNAVLGTVFATCLQPVTETLRLRNYKGSDKLYPASEDEPVIPLNYHLDSLVLTGWPMCNWVNDAFFAWIAQNALPYAMQVAGGALAGTINPMAGALGMVNTAVEAINSGYQAMLAPDIVKGDLTPGGAVYSAGEMNFYVARMSVNHQIAEQVDKFFDLYGYAIQQWATPRMWARPHWTYLKTSGCKIDGALPSEDAAEIEKLIDNGVRFWRNILNIGKYSTLDNTLSGVG